MGSPELLQDGGGSGIPPDRQSCCQHVSQRGVPDCERRYLPAQELLTDALTPGNVTLTSCAEHVNLGGRNIGVYFLKENKCDFRINQ